ncbi:signal recognition particle subunit SRP14, putative [Plasmodium knowlesi strain H]|uniref:Signal recognition particle 14 kDa protein n=3 Tax=Plasmodium knowlesi TaxID=5850 RepID=A0A5K1VNS6_PLAKH|nr:signal recognition particle subunit SRP14, putative [Plasmodium knowlesi strain H]OTN66868.1 putative Signal recognition particle subunit SRP14 [Plasmodium knowlesi]CAA9990071.1 signal recognition particle subunit SRP14, putative [Plasmodium knowlesi strain H]SBO25733.1 signal recognition particle subunit SRP14, putative [Plasmodium knowlesi strain H]SBO28543.1 signal recognition particle subunit SRP14, putative [Plasmodium knowlesi strain H]VVS79545.1 signal recognition particle subunit SR|eukprot:XP_002260538.1 signal recognition particle subunit,SRP14,putative [Plasmodium knowlesi strain H]
MVLLSNAAFIEELNKLCGEVDEKKKTSIWITMKKVKRSTVKNAITKKENADKKNKRTNKDDNKSNKKYVCLVRATDGKKKKFSTHVYDNVINFSQQLNTIMRS